MLDTNISKPYTSKPHTSTDVPSKLLAELSDVLCLSGDINVAALDAGAINHSYRLSGWHPSSASQQSFLLKHFAHNDMLCIDRAERFATQNRLAALGLAPQAIYLSDDQQWYVEQWIDIEQGQVHESHPATASIKASSKSFSHKQILILAEQLSRIHAADVVLKPLELATDWHCYLSAINSPTQHLRERVAAQSRLWQSRRLEHQSCHTLCHNDLAWQHVAGDTAYIFDWEYAGHGDRYFDLLSCAKVNAIDGDNYRYLCEQYARLNQLTLKTVLQECAQQEEFLQLTYDLWFEVMGL